MNTGTKRSDQSCHSHQMKVNYRLPFREECKQRGQRAGFSQEERGTFEKTADLLTLFRLFDELSPEKSIRS